VTWPDGSPLAGQPVTFVFYPDRNDAVQAETDDAGGYRADDLDPATTVRALLYVDSADALDANGGEPCLLPLIPSAHDPGDTWATTPATAPATDWTAAEHCLGSRASDWTADEADPDPGSASWKAIRDAL
jgi:hypothetical protein